MRPPALPQLRQRPAWPAWRRACGAFALAATTLPAAWAGPASAPASTPAPAVTAAAESGPPWRALTPGQQAALAPLMTEWPSIDAARKEKWLDVAARMPSMGATERTRIQQRMAEWVRLSPAERGRVRIQYQEARKVAPGSREQQWQAYQALSEDERRALAEKAAASRKPAATPPRPATATAATRPQSPAGATAEAKRNVVPFPPAGPAAGPPRQVGPAVVQARTGATTSLITTPARPPLHQQAGLPKVNASAGFVDPATLLPRRGPQGAAVVVAQPPSPDDDTP